MIGLVWRPIILKGRMTGPLEEFPGLKNISENGEVYDLLGEKVNLMGGCKLG